MLEAYHECKTLLQKVDQGFFQSDASGGLSVLLWLMFLVRFIQALCKTLLLNLGRIYLVFGWRNISGRLDIFDDIVCGSLRGMAPCTKIESTSSLGLSSTLLDSYISTQRWIHPLVCLCFFSWWGHDDAYDNRTHKKYAKGNVHQLGVSINWFQIGSVHQLIHCPKRLVNQISQDCMCSLLYPKICPAFCSFLSDLFPITSAYPSIIAHSFTIVFLNKHH